METAAPTNRRLGLVILLALVLLVLGWTLWKARFASDAPADRYLAFVCTECDHAFCISERDFERLWDRREFRVEDGRDFRVQCPNCQRFSARRDEGPPDAGPL